ncbi:FAD-binding oxidoreductase [Agromyces atrinae]|uniref:FAD-binding and (Fe-S)-binding domain-containing protein n=1 Tax=Agromyces atrinae TaxID=592376 RepID=UPI001F585286|nr:FAD-binding and (Fe-S)-binding domain-containing protein [Agromyces atrinae]MCI2957120.1 FAD-binding oxidoreductase [Agromyces atrinae]
MSLATASRAGLAPSDTAFGDRLRTALGPRTDDAVSVDSFDRIVAAVDASHFLYTPNAVVTAASTDDVVSVFRLANAEGRHVTLRSGGTSLSGQASADDILLDTRRGFRDIEPNADGSVVRVGPGATVRAVNARLARYGRKLGPDPASESAATIGGVIANNSSGMACGTVHNSYRTLRSLTAVLPSGTVVDTGRADADERLAVAEPELYAGLLLLRQRILGDPAHVAEIRRQYRGKNTMGYGLNSFLDFETPVEMLAHLLVGSEGSLGFVAGAEFDTIVVARRAATALVIFPDLASATGILPLLVETGAATIELMDAGSLRVVQADPTAAGVVDDLVIEDHAALLVEYQSTDDEGLAALVASAQTALAAAGAPAFEPTTDARERAKLWHVRKGLYAAIAGARPSGTTALLEDIAVPVESLAEACVALQQLFDRHGYADAVIFGHAKDGNIHFLLTEDFTSPDGVERQRVFTEDLVDLVLSRGGTLKAEHGTGRIMAPFVERQFGAELYGVMREVKRLCDPRGILNPGVLIGDDPEAHLTHLKLTPAVESEVDRCVDCGYCEPVCPSRDVTLTPRQRIAVRRARAAAQASGDARLDAHLARAEEYASVETCAVDGMCQTACPVLINTGDLVRRLRENEQPALVKAGGAIAAKQWKTVSRGAATALTIAKAAPAPLVTAATDVGRALLGSDIVPRYGRDLPRGGPKRAVRGASGSGSGLESTDDTIVLFAACVGSMFGAAGDGIGAAEAFRRLCERAGVSIVTPENADGLCCGTPWKSKGLAGGYATMVERVAASLVAASDRGRLTIVTDNSSCTEGLVLAIRHANRTGADPVDLRIEDSVDFAARRLLPGIQVADRLGSLALHPTCASTRLGSNDNLRALADAVAETVDVPDAWGCCGFAGDRGMLHPELTASATAPEAAELAGGGHDAHASCNRTCEIGMTRATGSEYRHVLELLEERTR